MDPQSATLTEACAPVLLYLTTFRRNSTTSRLTVEEVGAALRREFEKVQRRCDEDRRLRPLFERAHYALVAAADQILLTSAWAHKASWSLTPFEMQVFQKTEGGKLFFRFADEILADPGEGATEIAELLFTCMALGFQGELLGEPRELERRRRLLYEKAQLPGRVGETLTPEAYGRDLLRRVERLPTVGILRLVAVIAATLVFALVVGKQVTQWQNDDMLRRIRVAIEQIEPAPAEEE